MKFEAHREEAIRLLGAPFGEVHEWLDAYASTQLGARHRRRRHHLAGIEEVRRKEPSACVSAVCRGRRSAASQEVTPA